MQTTTNGAKPKRELPPDLARKIANARSSRPRYPNVYDGYYLFEVRKTLCEPTRNKGDAFILELGVVTATPMNSPESQGVTPNQPGTICAIVNLLNQDSAPGNVKAFILGVLGLDEQSMTRQVEHNGQVVHVKLTPDEVSAEIAETFVEVVSEQQPLCGMLVSAQTYRTKIKSGPNAGKPFVGVDWTYYPNQTGAVVAARRKLIEGGAIGSPVK